MSWNPKVKNKIPSPCTKDCANRKPGCGAMCDRFLDYVAERNASYDAERMRKDAKHYTYAGHRRG